MNNKLANIVYLSHGGGPLPILGDPGHKAMIDFMKALPQKLIQPKAILVISAHWEETVPTLIGSVNPSLFYDYYGFPEQAYDIQYPCPGAPEMVKTISEELNKLGIESRIETNRGLDHGVFIPLKLMYPQANIPTIQISLLKGLDPKKHIELGKALQLLKAKDVLIIGSGFSYHNMEGFFDEDRSVDSKNDAFQNWLITTCTKENQNEREQLLIDWEKAPNARYAHPREEHLLPLHVCMGIAGSPAEVIFDDQIIGKRSLGFCW
jgi:aromatic ring-opening dioxygenase catalytic subunit (LigB family)